MALKYKDIFIDEERILYKFWIDALNREKTIAGVYYCAWRAKRVQKKAKKRY